MASKDRRKTLPRHASEIPRSFRWLGMRGDMADLEEADESSNLFSDKSKEMPCGRDWNVRTVSPSCCCSASA
jgi:hypothetical protein